MRPRLTDVGYTTEETIEKPVGPYRIQSSESSISVMQTSDAFGIAGSIMIAPPIRYPMIRERNEASCRSQNDDFEMLVQRHKRTLDLLSR